MWIDAFEFVEDRAQNIIPGKSFEMFFRVSSTLVFWLSAFGTQFRVLVAPVRMAFDTISTSGIVKSPAWLYFGVVAHHVIKSAHSFRTASKTARHLVKSRMSLMS